MANNSAFVAVVLFLALFGLAYSEQNTVQPEAVHLSLGESIQQMVVTWTTHKPTTNSTVHYGSVSLDQVSSGVQTKFVDGGVEKRVIYIHRVYLKDLKPQTTYRYYVGSTEGWSHVYTFKTLPDAANWAPRIAVYGDMGATNARTIGRLEKEVRANAFDLILHVGDFAYDFHDDNGRVGDAFMKLIEPVAAYVPYQTCPGNHEQTYNFSHYDNRFSMHSEGDPSIKNHFWSYNIGPAHIISFSTEFYFYKQYGTNQIFNQYRWLEEDLKKANLPENRAKHPWVITMGHRPFYGELPDVDQQDDIIRKGNNEYPGLESLFYKHGVDISLFGHVHNYERMWPIYDGKVYNGSTIGLPYTNPKAPVHLTTGSAGCPEHLTPVLPKRPPYSAFIMSDYGFTRMHILNRTAVHFQQTSEAKNYTVVDDFYIIKDKHGVEAWK